ncbi:MAG: HPF/RaiA family ribosome-associated protein [Opitutaceae bacterium]|nr:HPF/RaiA family ribosome-associated protein [Opitutaceae bacterium]
MKLHLQHINLRSTDRLDRSIEEALFALLPLVRIEEARVRLEYRAGTSPAYRASAHLVVPGPDLHVEAVDHTVRTAFAKVLAGLRAQAAERAARRLPRPRGPGRRHFGAAAGMAARA